jgi:hypothetical protein
MSIINNNSTTTPLLAGTSFTGTANTTSDFITISTNIVSDTIAAVSIQQSSNRISWDVVKYFSYTTTAVSLVCTQDISLPFYRVVVQNISGTDMTYLRLYTILQTAEKEVKISNVVDISGNVVTTPITITKGTQGAIGFTIQALKDAGRNVTNYFSAIPIITTNADALMSLTGYKGGIAVGATTAPAVVTAAKIFNISQIVCTYVSVTTNGFANFTLRANLTGTVVIGSPAVYTWQVGQPSTIVTTGIAGVSNTITISFPDGLQFAAGTGIGVSVQGYSATVAAAAVGYASVAISGYEY